MPITSENTEVNGFDSALRGMRNPMDSWDKADSKTHSDMPLREIGGGWTTLKDVVDIGSADMGLCSRLVRSGSEHRKFLRFIHVTADLSLPLMVWKQMDTYKFMETNSCSTMHKLSSRHLEKDDFIHDAIDEGWLESYIHVMNGKIDIINNLKKRKQDGWKEHERSLYEMLIQSYIQKRTVTFDYETLLSIYRQRSGHKLYEWIEICRLIEGLPYMKAFIHALG